MLEVYTFRQQPLYETGLESVAQLGRTLTDVRAGRWANNATIAAMTDVAVTSLSIQTTLMERYRAYLGSVEMFLAHSGGVTVGRFELDAAGFRDKFLRAAGGCPCQPRSVVRRSGVREPRGGGRRVSRRRTGERDADHRPVCPGRTGEG